MERFHQGNNWDIVYQERVGDTWGEILNLSNTPGFSVSLRLHDNVHVVWEESWRIYGFLRVLVCPYLGPGSLSQFGTDVHGNVYVVWEEEGLWCREKMGFRGQNLQALPKVGRTTLPYLSPQMGIFMWSQKAGIRTLGTSTFMKSPRGRFNVTHNPFYCWVTSVLGLPNGRAYVSWTMG